MSNTPETDAEAWIETDRANAVVFAKFARKLERERDEARTTIEDAKRALNATAYEGILLAAMRAKEERDEARESLKHITEYGTEEINAAVELRQKLATALVERDEAREQVENQKVRIGELMDFGNKLADECDRILGLGLHQNTLLRFKDALESWRKNT